MALTIKHPFVCTVPDDPLAAAAGEVVSTNWNDTHSLSGTLDQPNIGNITATGANTPRPIGDYFTEVYSLKDFGPTGTANDTATFNTASLAVSNSGGGKIIVPTGTYVVGGTFPIHLYHNVWLCGEGAGSILQSAATVTKSAVNPLQVVGLIQVGGDGGGNSNNVRITDLNFSDNGFTDIGSGTINVAPGATDFVFERNIITNASQLAVALGATTRFCITNNYILKTVQPQVGGFYSQIQAILVVASGESKYGVIANNDIVGAALDVCLNEGIISGNKISGFVFGNGIVTEQSPFCYNLQINDNIIWNGIGTDVNGTHAGGIENWAKDTTISGNIIFGNSGVGIDHGGQNGTVSNNICYDNATSQAGLHGLGARYADATYNANNTVYSNNRSYNTAGVGGPQGYGYSEQSALLSGITIIGNNLNTNAIGPTNIQSATTTIINPDIVKLNGGKPIQLSASAFAGLSSSPVAGMVSTINNSSVTAFGAVIGGTGATTVLGWYNGTNWTVIGS